MAMLAIARRPSRWIPCVSLLASVACGTGDEGGFEVVYRLSITEVGWLWASVEADAGVDVDVQRTVT